MLPIRVVGNCGDYEINSRVMINEKLIDLVLEDLSKKPTKSKAKGFISMGYCTDNLKCLYFVKMKR